jgi:hypothetical protein
MAIVIAGCVAQQEGEELLRRVPEIDMVMGPQYANRLGDLLEGVFNGNQVCTGGRAREGGGAEWRGGLLEGVFNGDKGCNGRG